MWGRLIHCSKPANPKACIVAGHRVDHNIKGQGIYAYVVLAEGTKPSAELKKKLNDVVRNQIGSFAVPDTIHWAPGDHRIVMVMQ